MVKPRFLSLCIILLVPLLIGGGKAQDLVYHLDHEWVRIWVNPNRTIDILYDIIIVCDAGTLHWVEIGQPNGDFTVGSAFDEFNNELSTIDTTVGDHFKVRVDIVDLEAGEKVRFNLTTNVANMLVDDSQNPGNFGLLFNPSWFPVSIGNLRVQIILPSGVTENNTKTLVGVDWDNADYVDGNFAVYWERSNLAPNEVHSFGVSFPKEFIPQPGFLETYGPWILLLSVLLSVGAVLAVILRKKSYIKPVLSVEALGIRRGLTAVEASYLLDLKPERVVTIILYSLLKKRAVWVTDTKPSVKVKVMTEFKHKKPSELADRSLRYYEIDFLNSMKPDGTLDEEKLAETIVFLGRTVEQKLRGYCRRDTVDYYNRIVEKAWSEVEQSVTSDVTSKLYDAQLLWLLLDPQHRRKTKLAFRNRVFQPSPLWFWYWYSYTHYHPRPKFQPNVAPPAQSPAPPKIPGSEFANNIASAVENTSKNIVSNIEKFANAVIPTASPPKTSHKPAHHRSSCICACASCACACACVSCACACAGGGAG